MSDQSTIDTIKERFKEHYPGKRLLAFSLDGFSHSIWFDDGTSESKIEQHWYSACMPEARSKEKNCDQVKQLFKGFTHNTYQHNAMQIALVLPEDR